MLNVMAIVRLRVNELLRENLLETLSSVKLIVCMIQFIFFEKCFYDTN